MNASSSLIPVLAGSKDFSPWLKSLGTPSSRQFIVAKVGSPRHKSDRSHLFGFIVVPKPFRLRDFPHFIHQLLRMRIGVDAQRTLRHWRQPGGPSDKAADSQEQTRRVMVRGLLQNEGIAGIQECTGSHRMSPGVQAREELHRDRNRYGNSSSRSRLHFSLLFAPACTGNKRLDRDEKWGSFHR